MSAAIVPDGPEVDAQDPPVQAGLVANAGRWAFQQFSAIYAVWELVQVSRHGAYTGRRARALVRYVRSASLARVLSVCILTPLPVLAFVLLQEIVPLEAPAQNWKDNYRWFIRSAVTFMVLTLSYIRQAVIFLSPLKVSLKQALSLTVSTTAAYFATLVLISTVWVFPIPFSCVLTTGAFTCFFLGLFVVVIGWKTLANTPRLSARVRILKGVLIVELVIVFVYPAFNAVFRVLQGAQQLAFMLVLYVLKVVMRFIMAYVLQRGKGGVGDEKRWRARLPEVVVFSTELFHVLYLTACLQGDRVTIWATIGFSLFDTAGSLVSVRHLLKRPSMVFIPAEIWGPSRHALSVVVPVLDSVLLPAPSTKLSVINSAVSTRFSSTARRASASQRLSAVLATGSLMIKLAKRSSSRSRTSSKSRHSRRSVARRECDDNPRPEREKLKTHRSQDIVDEVSRLETLSMTEYFLLVEYVKCIIPAMYGIFQVVLVGLPNAIYYPSLAKATPHDLHRTQINMLVFVSTKVFSLAIFVRWLRRRLKFSVLHQLAFVLETAADDIQAKLAMFIPYCFFFFLKHNGVDYSFQFSWIQQA